MGEVIEPRVFRMKAIEPLVMIVVLRSENQIKYIEKKYISEGF